MVDVNKQKIRNEFICTNINFLWNKWFRKYFILCLHKVILYICTYAIREWYKYKLAAKMTWSEKENNVRWEKCFQPLDAMILQEYTILLVHSYVLMHKSHDIEFEFSKNEDEIYSHEGFFFSFVSIYSLSPSLSLSLPAVSHAFPPLVPHSVSLV